MAQTMYAADGVGLAAPQVGILRRVCIVDVGDGLIELVNPVIVKQSGLQESEEGCLSCPGKVGTTHRPNKVTVEYFDRNGKEKFPAASFLQRLFAMKSTIWTEFFIPSTSLNGSPIKEERL